MSIAGARRAPAEFRVRRRPPESSPAAPSRRGFPRHVFPFRRLAALAGGFRRSLPAAVLLALAALVPVLPISSAVAQEVVEVPRNSPLKPSGLAAAQKEFRLLFVTSAGATPPRRTSPTTTASCRAAPRAGHRVDPAVRLAIPGSTSAARLGRCPRQHLDHLHVLATRGCRSTGCEATRSPTTTRISTTAAWDDERNGRGTRAAIGFTPRNTWRLPARNMDGTARTTDGTARRRCG